MTGALPGKDTPAAHTAPASTTSRRSETDKQNTPPARATDPADPAQPAPPPETWTTIADGLRLIGRGRTTRTAVPIALVVGTLLSGVNEGAEIAGGHAHLATRIRAGVNYAVLFTVASLGWLSARRVGQQRSAP